MTYAKLTLKELKSICKDNHLKNYSTLNKTELIAFIKNKKKKQNKKKVGGFFNGILNRETLLELLGNISEGELINLEEISLYNKNITSIDPDTFNGLTKLKTLYLNNNQIKIIDPDTFNGLTKLQKLFLSNNQIKSIEPDTLNILTNLTELFLTSNQITTIVYGSFNGLTNLRVLEISNNNITIIEHGAFTGLTNLTGIYLMSNKISINPNIFKELTNLQELYLQDNKITTIQLGTFTGLTNLQQLFLNNCRVTRIEPNTFKELTNLQQLYLQDNKITTIQSGAFNGLMNLQRFELNNNKITRIQSGAFTGLTNLQKLDLEYNRITTIVDGSFDGLTNLRYLKIHHNHLTEQSLNHLNTFIQIISGERRIYTRNIIIMNTTITKNMRNTNNDNHNHKLYNHILTIDGNTLQTIRFEFEGDPGINAGGLTRTVYDIFYHSYIKKFFNENNDGNLILKKINNSNNIKIFENATTKLIILAKKGDVKIVIPIHETLFEILESVSPMNTINPNNQQKYNKNNRITNLTRETAYEDNESMLSDVISSINDNNRFNKKWSNIKHNNIDDKKEVFLRRFLHSQGFITYKEFEYMHIWFKKYWDKEIFTCVLSFTKKDFFKRILIIKSQSGNIPRQEYKISSNNNSSNSINKLIKNNTNGSLIKDFINLKVILQYINQDDDECRKKFNKFITGSIYGTGVLKFLLITSEDSIIPMLSHTCFNRLDIYTVNDRKPNTKLSNSITNLDQKYIIPNHITTK